MSRHVRALIKRAFGMIVTETPYNAAWVAAIKEIIPQSSRNYNNNIWSFDLPYYSAVKTITEHYFGSVIDSTGGVSGMQAMAWKEKWSAFLEIDRLHHDNGFDERQRFRDNDNRIRAKAPASAFATLFVTENAPPEVITAVVRALRVKHHPDNGGNTEVMARINAAYDELKKKGRA